VASRWIQLTDQLSFSGTAPNSDRIAIPRGRYDAITLAFDYNVTDAGVLANGIDAAVVRLQIGEGANLPIQSEVGEMHIVVDALAPGLTTGLFSDPAPVTTVQQKAWFKFIGPFNFNNMNRPDIRLLMSAVAGFPTPTVFDCKVSVMLQASADQTGFGYYMHRESRATSTRHEVPIGPSFVVDIFHAGGATANLRRIRLPQIGVGGTPSQTIMALDCTEYNIGNAEYCARKQVATATGAYYWAGLNVPYYPDRTVIIENGTTDTLLLFAKNMVA